MTQDNPPVEVTPEDRRDYAEFALMIGRISERDAGAVRDGEWDRTKDVQWFARHRLASQRPAVGDEVVDMEGLLDAYRALEELVECARLRGDTDLPHPCDDPKLWTARMQDAWHEAERVVDNVVIAAMQPQTPATGDVGDLVERLRETRPRYNTATGEYLYSVFCNRDGEEAAAKLTELQAEVERLRK